MSPDQIEIVCHRGANEFAPENTFASAQKCIDWGMDYVEIDVNVSSDGVHYLFHGPQLERTTNGNGMIMHHPAAYIDQLDAGSWFGAQFAGEKIPRLDRFLPWIKGKAKLFLDVKWGNLETIIALIRQHRFEEECFFWFKLPELAIEFRRLAPDLALKVNAGTGDAVDTAVAQFRADIIETDYPIPADVVQAVRRQNLTLMINYMGSDPSIFADIIAQQPNMVNVDYGDRFAQALGRKIEGKEMGDIINDNI